MRKSARTRRRPPKSPHVVEMNEAAVSQLRNASRKEVEAVYAMMESSEEGILQATAEERISKFGLNEVAHDKPPTWFEQFVKSFVNPFIFILLAIAVISFVIDVWLVAPGEKDYKTVIVVATMIVISGLLSFFQEYRSNRAAEALKVMVRNTTAILR